MGDTIAATGEAVVAETGSMPAEEVDVVETGAMPAGGVDVVETGATPGRVVAESAEICCVLPEGDEVLDVELLEEGGAGRLLLFLCVPPTAPPITPPTTRITMTKMVIIPLRVRQNDWAGFLGNVEVVGGNFSCEPFSTSVSIGGGGESGWVERGR